MIDHPDPQVVRNQLSRMLDSRYFRTSPRLRLFLLYTVEQGLAGCEDRLKEYCIALAVFGKPDSFDPRVDSAVRVAARQLRAKIDVYYLNEGINDPVSDPVSARRLFAAVLSAQRDSDRRVRPDRRPSGYRRQGSCNHRCRLRVF